MTVIGRFGASLSRRPGGWLPRCGSLRRRPAGVVIAGLAVVCFGGLVLGAVVLTTSGPAPTTVTAEFAEAPGLYVGNSVDVLGIPVGHVTKVTPGPNVVTVQMHVKANVRIPSNAGAFLMAPNVVNDRYVQLDPAYTGGPALSDGAIIPDTRTADPVSVDQIFATLDQLAVALGPQGANANGALSQLIHDVARAFAGDGPALHATISSFGQALGALSSNSAAVTALIDNLGNLTDKAAQASGSYERFAGDLATVSSALAADSTDISQALSNLQQALAQVAAFVQANGTSLGASVTSLAKVAAAVGRQQATLAQLLSVSPLALQNLQNTYDPNPPGGGGPALRARYDPVGNSPAFATSICGNSVLRLLLLAVDQSQDKIPTIDLACGVAYSLQTLPVPPGASAGPNLSLRALMAPGR